MRLMSRRSRARGVSLIEIMISLVIGLVVVGAVMVSMIGSSKGGKYQAAYTQMNEDAQIALSILSRDLQMAGYSQPTGLVNSTPFAATATMVLTFNTVSTSTFVIGCDTGFSNPATASTCGTATTSAVEVVYEADKDNTVQTAGKPSNCLGNAIAGVAPFVARNRYLISTGGSGRPELNCASGGKMEPLVENIDKMKIWYGVYAVLPAPPQAPQIVRYVTATEIAALGAGAAAEWGRVISARVCLLVRSSEPVLSSGEDTLTYSDCDAIRQTSNDRYLRRAYFTTATFRDKMP